MNNIYFRIYWALSWIFCLCWCFYGATKLGWDTIMPFWFKIPCLISFFGPPLVLCIIALIQLKKIK